MLTTLKNAFKIKEIRKKLLFTFLMLVVIRIGCQLPVPGVNRHFFSNWFAAQTGDTFSFFNAFTGGSFENMSLFALNITPYITSSIIIQLLTIAIPKLEEMQRDGEEGRKKLTSITRYVTVGLALIESAAMAIGFGRQGLMDDFNALNVITVIAALTAGSAFLMWIGERITENGVGNGISIVLTINIISRMPSDLSSLYQQFVKGKAVAVGALAAVIILAIIVGMVILVIILMMLYGRFRYSMPKSAGPQDGRRTIHLYSLKGKHRRCYPGYLRAVDSADSDHHSQLTGYKGTGPWAYILRGLNSSYWCKPSELVYSIGLIVYIVMVIFFAYFYTSITFNPLEIADNMKKQGGFIPGIRPGKPTSDYLNKILNYLIFIGACGLTIVCVLPYVFNGVFGASVSFGGTSLIIIVSVLLETLKQIESQMMVRNYKGFLND